jgi:heme-degrading monooxygenase HmoA
MIITIFRSRLRPEHRAEFDRWETRIHGLAVKMPGFVSIKTFAADDDERVSLVEFESESALQAWREHPEHREAQALGRTRFYAEYHIQVCAPIRDYCYPKKA